MEWKEWTDGMEGMKWIDKIDEDARWQDAQRAAKKHKGRGLGKARPPAAVRAANSGI